MTYGQVLLLPLNNVKLQDQIGLLVKVVSQGIEFHLSNRKRFLCLHSLISTQEGLGEFETVKQTRDKIEGLQNKYRQKGFYCFYKLTFPRNNAKLFVMALINLKSCRRSLAGIISSYFAKKILSKIWIFLT